MMNSNSAHHHHPHPPLAAATEQATKNTLATTEENKNSDRSPPSSPPRIKAGEGDSKNTPEEPKEEDKGKETTFPQQLMELIEEETKDGVNVDGERVIEWLPAGDSFVIRDNDAFETRVLPGHFSAKCKFASFVRKLYRWGFRQVERSIPRIMIFAHVNFVRGDKRRCLKMRSNSKRQAAQRVHPPFANNLSGIGMGAQRLQMLGPMDGRCDMTNGTNGTMGQGNAMGPNQLLEQVLRSQVCLAPFNQGGGDGLANLSNIIRLGQGGGPSSISSVRNHFAGAGGTAMAAGGASGMASTDAFAAGLRLGQANRLRFDSALPMLLHGSPNENLGNVTTGDFADEVALASEIMKRVDPGMEPQRALELAKRLNGAKF